MKKNLFILLLYFIGSFVNAQENEGYITILTERISPVYKDEEGPFADTKPKRYNGPDFQLAWHIETETLLN